MIEELSKMISKMFEEEETQKVNVVDIGKLVTVDTDKYDVTPKKEYKKEILNKKIENLEELKEAYKFIIEECTKSVLEVTTAIKNKKSELKELED